MKIKETVERDCCHPSHDFKKYVGKPIPGFGPGDRLSFCQHCGQLWWWNRSPGEMDYGWEPAPLKAK